jgi:hypothetical protein
MEASPWSLEEKAEPEMKEQGQEVEEYERDLDDSPLPAGGGQREALAAKEG